MNIFGINNSSNLVYKQAVLKDLEIATKLSEAQTEDEVSDILDQGLLEFVEEAGKPLFKPIYPNRGGYPIAEHYNKNNSSIFNDIALISSELEDLSMKIVKHFNYRQLVKETMKSRLTYLSSLCADYVLSASLEEENTYYINQHFNSTDKIAMDATIEQGMAHIDTRVGVLTLKRSETIEHTKKAKVIKISGNGMAGNHHLIKLEKDIPSYLSDIEAHDIINTILDGNPDTWFEYQMINLDEEIKEGWLNDLSWCKGEKHDLLTLKLVIELNEVVNINWINLNPHIPAGGNKVTVKLIRTSATGTNWQELYKDKLILNSEINTTAQSFRGNDITSDMDTVPEKFAGQGVWSFPSRPVKFIEIVLEQDEHFPCNIGHMEYKQVNIGSDGEVISEVAIPEARVSSEIKTGGMSKYLTENANEYIEKSLAYDEGWRYCIGIKDLGIHSYKYADRSELTTVMYEVPDTIKEIVLYTNEYIPASFLEDFKKINSWITYEISLDGHTFYPISPMHRNPVGKGELKTSDGENTLFPPKIYEVNPENSYEVQQNIFYKGYINTSKNPKQVQLRITLNRPNGSEFETPSLDSFALKIRTEEEFHAN